MGVSKLRFASALAVAAVLAFSSPGYAIPFVGGSFSMATFTSIDDRRRHDDGFHADLGCHRVFGRGRLRHESTAGDADEPYGARLRQRIGRRLRLVGSGGHRLVRRGRISAAPIGCGCLELECHRHLHRRCGLRQRRGRRLREHNLECDADRRSWRGNFAERHVLRAGEKHSCSGTSFPFAARGRSRRAGIGDEAEPQGLDPHPSLHSGRRASKGVPSPFFLLSRRPSEGVSPDGGALTVLTLPRAAGALG